MKLDKVNLVISIILIILLIFLVRFDNPKTIYNENNSLEKLNSLSERMSQLENSIPQNNIETSTIQIINRGEISCALVAKEYGSSKLVLYDYTNDGELEEVGDIAKDGYEYLKTLGNSKHNVYHGIQCRKDNGWILVNGGTGEYLVKNIDGELKVIKDEFLENNGYFSIRGNVQIICCKVN